jgi:nitrate/nitrite-specific signal transduction histidine kinase
MQAVIPLDLECASSLQLARRLHDTIAQRLTGLSCFLGDSEQPAPEDAVERCRLEIHAAIDELRELLDSVGRNRPARASQLDAEMFALRTSFPDLDLVWKGPHGGESNPDLLDSFLVEAICNIRKHARPSRVTIESQQVSGATIVSVTNDGVLSQPGRGTRQGSRLLALEATAFGAITDSHADGVGRWQQRLIMPNYSSALSA